MPAPRLLVCPYCGEPQPPGARCRVCGGLFDALSRQASQNDMGPWYVRDREHPFRPGCSYETLLRLVERGRIDRNTILRGPTTRQLWTVARRVPGVAHLLGSCHGCGARVKHADPGCAACGASFTPGAELLFERDRLGLAPVRPLPWDAGGEDEPVPPRRNGAGAHAPAPRGGSLSSFAPDAELLEPGDSERGAPREGMRGAAAVAGVRERGTPSVIGSAGPPDAGERHGSPRLEGLALDALGRSLQRTVAQQQRTIRVLLAVVAVLAIATGWAAVRALTDPGRTPAAAGHADAADPADGAGPRSSATAPIRDDSVDPGPSASDEAEPPASNDAAAAIARAHAALAFLELDPPPPIDERRAAVAAALEALESIGPDGATSDEASALRTRLEAARGAIELESFLPGTGA